MSVVFTGEFVRSFWIADEIQRYADSTDTATTTRRSIFLRSDFGSTYVAYRLHSWPKTVTAESGVAYSWQLDMPGKEISWDFKLPPGPRPQWLGIWTVWEKPGFLFATTAGRRGAGGHWQRMLLARFPTPILVLLFAMPLLIHLAYQRVRRRRVKKGRCIACNYNLTGNTSGVCPECGEPVEAVAKTAQTS